MKIERLIWDETNIEHIARHQVTPEEAEEVCHSDFIVLVGKKGRSVVIAYTKRGSMLAVMLDPEPSQGAGVYYPVTARPAARKERRLYQQMKGGENHDTKKTIA